MINRFYTKALALLALLVATPFSAQWLFAPPPPPDPSTGIPIGGGTGILLAAGAAYGAKKLYEHYRGRSNNNETQEPEA
jgi:hypothetical protein